MNQRLLLNLTSYSIGIMILLCSSCQKEDDAKLINTVEHITTLTYTLTPIEGGDPVVWSYSDPDGLGGNDPEVTFEPLTPFTIYNGVI